MAVKQFYISTPDLSQNVQLSLVVELGNDHIACVATNDQKECVAMEYYTFQREEWDDADALLQTVVADSQVMKNNYAQSELFIHNDLSVIVPHEKFNKEIAEEYLRIAFGEAGQSEENSVENVPGDFAKIVFRFSNTVTNALRQHIAWQTIHHSYSKVIGSAMQLNANGNVLLVQFYHAHIVVCAMQRQQLILIRSLEYQLPDDVLYYLLSITNQLQLSADDLEVCVSGMIDQQSNLYIELEKYFEKVILHTSNAAIVQQNGNGHPAHYFTPICNLVCE